MARPACAGAMSHPPVRTSSSSRLLRVALLHAGLLAPGCQTGEAPRADASAERATVAIPPLSVSPHEGLRLDIEVPREVRRGARVLVVFRAVNVAPGAVDLYLRGRSATLDVEVTNERGEVVWRRLETEVIPAIVMTQTIAPGDTLEVRAEWDQRTRRGDVVPAGEYRARALLLTDGPDPLATPTAPLRVLP